MKLKTDWTCLMYMPELYTARRLEEPGAGTEACDIIQTARRDLRGGRRATGGSSLNQKTEM